MKIIIIAVIVIGLITYMLLNNKKMKTYKNYMNRKKRFDDAIKNFISTEKYINQNMAIAINNDDKKFCICVMKNGAPASFIYRFDEITGCEILEDGSPVSTVKPIESGKINRIDLKIFFKDSENPFIFANFLFWDVMRDSEEYKTLFNDTMHWYEIITNSIKK